MECYTHISARDQQDSGYPESHRPGHLMLNSSVPGFIQPAPAADDVTPTAQPPRIEGAGGRRNAKQFFYSGTSCVFRIS